MPEATPFSAKQALRKRYGLDFSAILQWPSLEVEARIKWIRVNKKPKRQPVQEGFAKGSGGGGGMVISGSEACALSEHDED